MGAGAGKEIRNRLAYLAVEFYKWIKFSKKGQISKRSGTMSESWGVPRTEEGPAEMLRKSEQKNRNRIIIRYAFFFHTSSFP